MPKKIKDTEETLVEDGLDEFSSLPKKGKPAGNGVQKTDDDTEEILDADDVLPHDDITDPLLLDDTHDLDADEEEILASEGLGYGFGDEEEDAM